MITDPFFDVPYKSKEIGEKDGCKYWEGTINIPKSYKGYPIRMLAKWYSSRRYGFATCILTDDYSKRADEPVEIFVNGKLVSTYDGDITNYVEYGEDNTITLKVLYDKVFDEEASVIRYGTSNFLDETAQIDEMAFTFDINQRPSVKEYSLHKCGDAYD